MCAASSCDQEEAAMPLPPRGIAIKHTDYFLDLSAPYGGRLSDLQYLENKKKEREAAAWELLLMCFQETFYLLYTRFGARWSPIELLLMMFLPFLALASVVVFATSDKHGYDSTDVKVTYILFFCTTLLEFMLPLLVLVFRCFPCLNSILEDGERWKSMVSQYDLMSFYSRKKNPTFLMKIVFFKSLREYVSKEVQRLQRPADSQLLKRFSDQRRDLGEELWDSLEVPFDKSILLWHMATNLCFHRPVDKPASFLRSQSDLTKRSMEMSNYMLYLLFIRTEMLLPGTRPGLFSVAIYELEDMLKNNKEKLESEEAVAQEIIKHTDGSSLIHEACRLAVSLMMKLDEEEMWKIIQGVWVEMLCYSASRSRGYLHAKCLGEGGEYLSYVWLLWSYMGMQTLADKIQKPESPAQREIIHVANVLASPSNRQTSTSGILSPV